MVPKYTIAVCNYNMSNTLRRSIERMIEITNEQYEILVVDDGSTDNSVEILRKLKSEYDRIRVVELEPDPDRNLGATRNISVRESNGDYVLLQLDADDVYIAGIEDFTKIYHQLESQLDFGFYFKGNSINIAKRSFLLEFGPYRNLEVGAEDLDLWRRLFADNAIIWFDHDDIAFELGDGKSLLDMMVRDFRITTSEFQTGLYFWDYLQSKLAQTPTKAPWYLIVYPVAYVVSRFRVQYELPEEFRFKNTLENNIKKERRTLSEIESHYGVTIDRSVLSDEGVQIFCDMERQTY